MRSSRIVFGTEAALVMAPGLMALAADHLSGLAPDTLPRDCVSSVANWLEKREAVEV